MIANDIAISDWVYGIVHGEPEPAGDFLKAFAEAVVRADLGNYQILRPVIVVFMERFPKYHCSCPKD